MLNSLVMGFGISLGSFLGLACAAMIVALFSPPKTVEESNRQSIEALKERNDISRLMLFEIERIADALTDDDGEEWDDDNEEDDE